MADRHPNIVVILADDLGYGDVSRLNPESKIRTPRMDGLAAEGMTCTDAHSNSAVCTPTRYGLLTGRYSWRGRLESGVLMGYSETLIEDGRTTLASLLRDAGYRTACIGKWHLGLDWPLRDDAPEGAGPNADTTDFTRPVGGGPQAAGFDESFIIPASLDMEPYCYLENGVCVEPADERVADSPRPAYWRGGAIAPGFRHETCLLELTVRAEQFIRSQATERPDQPFFLYFPTPSPHTPHVPRPPFRGKSDVGEYGDFVVEHDWSVGRVIDALDRNGFRDDTLVIVTSDNGAHCAYGLPDGADEGYFSIYGHRSNHIYRGQKSDAWDGGHRIPFFARMPGVIEPGSVCDDTVCLTDIFATAAELTGTDLADDAGEDSASMLPLLRGEAPASPREAVVHHSINGTFAIRKGRWKLLECGGSGGWTRREEQVPDGAPDRQLYDMEADESERRNVIAEHPEVVADLQETLDRYRDEPRSVAR